MTVQGASSRMMERSHVYFVSQYMLPLPGRSTFCVWGSHMTGLYPHDPILSRACLLPDPWRDLVVGKLVTEASGIAVML